MTITLEPALSDAMPVLANLLELYQHDLSATFSVDVAADGRFGYAPLSLYWSEPERRFPFLIHCDGKLAGFALATRGSPASDDPDVYDVAEFFVLRRYRRASVGRRAAHLLWDRLPGRWFVRVFVGNTAALGFWSGVMADYAGADVRVQRMQYKSKEWQVLSFQSSTR